MSTATLTRLTADEYLTQERAAHFKSEFFSGEVLPMSGGSEAHNLISLSVGSELRRVLRGKGCRIYSTDMRVWSPCGLYTYPDVSVVIDQPKFDDVRRDILLNPVLLVEVLSPSTEAYDRGRKFERYRAIESLQTYILISQDRPSVEVYSRGTEGHWIMAEFHAGTVHIPTPACQIEISEIYDQVDFSTAQVTPEDADA